MCKTYDAIFELSKHVESNILICSVGEARFEGELFHCGFDKDKCYDSIVTLKNAKIHCCKSQEEKEYKWINIPTKHIKAFAFKCCELQ